MASGAESDGATEVETSKDLEGPVEALSHDAAESLASGSYLNEFLGLVVAGMASCTQGAGYLKQPENQWLSHCASAPKRLSSSSWIWQVHLGSKPRERRSCCPATTRTKLEGGKMIQNAMKLRLFGGFEHGNHGQKETPRPCDTMHGSFYPFPLGALRASEGLRSSRLAKDMEWCLKQSGYYYIEAPCCAQTPKIY